MSKRVSPLFSSVEPELLTGGLTLDRHPLQSNLWRTLKNVESYAAALNKTKPRALLTTLGAAPLRGLAQLQTAAGIKRVYTGNASTLYGYDFSVNSSTGGFTGAVNDSLTAKAAAWSFEDFGDWMLAANGVDAPQIAKNSLTFVPLATAGLLTRAQILRKKATFLLAFNTQLGTDVVQWCNSDNVEDWAVGVDKTAGNLRIRELDGPIIAAEHLGAEIAAYGATQMFRLGVRSSPFWFGYNFGLVGIGAVGPLAVCADDRMNYGVSRQGIWKTDGFSYVYLDALPGREMRNWLQKNVNWAQASKIVARRNELANTIDFSFPLGTSLEPNFVLRWNLAAQNWVTSPFVITTADKRRVTTAPLSADAEGRLFLDEQTTPHAGDDNTALVESRPLMLGTPKQAAYIDEVQVLTQTPGSLEWRIGAHHTLDAAINWMPWVSAEANMAISNTRLEGVYFYFQARSTTSTDDWQFAGFLFYGVGDGMDRTVNS